jgi:hypothetical protein
MTPAEHLNADKLSRAQILALERELDNGVRDEANTRMVDIERMQNAALQLNAPADSTNAIEITSEAP